jgi:hypothetical protein
MKKMKLDFDALDVESFDTAEVEERVGTVHGAAQTEWNTCPGYGETCGGGDTCWDSCNGTCRCVTGPGSCDAYHSCAVSCGCTEEYYQSCTFTGC